MVIKNFEKLANSMLRRNLLRIAESGYEAINTACAIKDSVSWNSKRNILSVRGKKIRLATDCRLFVLAFGKAALESAKALEGILGERIHAGLVLDILPEGEKFLPKNRWQYFFCTHPRVSEQNIQASNSIREALENLTEKDIVICCISGGGSAMLEIPYGLTVENAVDIFKSLTHAGASISEINTVRKHTSRVKGGQLAKALYPAIVINLIFSDVPGNDFSLIASGPTVKDLTTSRQAMDILNKYKAVENSNLRKISLLETPKEDKYFKNVTSYLLVSADKLLNAMKIKAEELGWEVKIWNNAFQGEARILAQNIIESAKNGQCLLGAEESTVKILNLKGTGGRNQEMALSALNKIYPNQVFGCFASDGHDNTDAAGAIADYSTLERSRNLGLFILQYLDNNDSYRFFSQTDDLVLTGLTGSNAADFFICLQK